MNQADQSLRRNPLARWHESVGGQTQDQRVVTYPNHTTPALGLTDLNGLPRLGFKGADTVAWLTRQGLELPEQANTALFNNGLVVARLSLTEFFLAALSDAAADTLTLLRGAWSLDLAERTYLLERADSHACVALTGPQASDMLAKVCAIDLRAHKFGRLSVAQTSVARSNAIVVRIDTHAAEPQFLIFSDLSSVEYHWECLLDAMQEFAGNALAYPQFIERLK